MKIFEIFELKCGQFSEINQDNQNTFDHSGAKQISTHQILIFTGHLGVVKHTEAKKFWIGLNFIEIRDGSIFELWIQEHLYSVIQNLWPPLL